MPNLQSSPLLAALPMGALILDHRLSVLEVNDAFLDLLEHTREQVSGTTFEDLLLTPIDEALTTLLSDDATQRLELDVRFTLQRGGILSASISVSRIPDSAENPPRLLAIVLRHAMDQTDVKPTTAADEVLSLIQAASWELELATERIYAPKTWCDLWGFSPDETIDHNDAIQRILPADREQVLAALRHACETTEPISIRFRVPDANGEIRWFESTGQMKTTEGSLTGRMYGVVMDITERCKIDQALARYADIVSSSPDRIAYVDRGCRLLAANTPFLRAAHRLQARNNIGYPFKDVCGDGPLTALLYRSLGRCLDRQDIVVEDIREIGRNGLPRDAEVRLFPHLDDQGAVAGIVINIRDVTQLRGSELRLRQSAAVYASTSEGVVITDADGTIVSVNSAFSQITGYTAAEVVGNKPNLLNSNWHPKRFFVRMWRQLLRSGFWQGEIWNRRKDGEIYWQKLTIRSIQDSRNRVVNFVGVFAESTANLGSAPRRAEHLIHYDALTKLPNRLLFESRLDHALELGQHKGALIATLLVDLDRFSHINSSLGHHIGDELLRAIAFRLRETVRPSDTLARLRADQFALIIEDIADPKEVEEIARRLQSTLGATIWVNGHEMFVTVSIGIAFNTGSDIERQTIIARAESALRLVKRQGRNGFRIATAGPAEPINDQQGMVELMRNGLRKNEFKVLYRIGHNLLTKDCSAVQARLHWTQREQGLIPPERFPLLTNDSGLLLELGQLTLHTACEQLQAWLSRGLAVESMLIGISEAQLVRSDLIKTLTLLVKENPLIAHRLELEFSESLLVKHREQIAEVFSGANRLGILTSLSEVGAGWTAPAVLQRLPIKTLGIHADFVECLSDSVHDQAVVQAVINMAQALNLSTRADGVRSDKQFNLLSNMGCNQALGDLCGEPLCAAEIQTFLDPNSAPSRSPTYKS
ncbi:EAL and GGDEF domain-containing protein [Thiorhodococcus fuscus]|uniref:EAL domain-containing protein n=1 Tax=Thiorhodococcus fuscus TaxID=527200 RepID=A0ABW4Y431_9GAMM